MSHGNVLWEKSFKKEAALSQYLPLSHLLSPTIFETTSGQVGATFKLQGVSVDTSTNDQINEYKRILHHAITHLNEEFFVMMTTHRHRENITLPNKNDNPILSQISKRYNQPFQQQHFYANDLYLTVLYKGLTSGKMGKGFKLIHAFSHKNMKHSRDLYRQTQIKKLHKAIGELQSLLSVFEPHLLGKKDEALGYSELLRFFTLFFNGGETFSLEFCDQYPLYEKRKNLNTTKNAFDAALKAYQRYPTGKLNTYLLQKQMFFGRYIQFQGVLEKDQRFADILSIKTYGDQTGSVMLDTLLQLDAECLITNSFALEPKAEVLKKIDRHRNKLIATNDVAHSQREALDTLKDELASERVAMGYHHHTLLLWSDSVNALEEQMMKALKCFSDAGIIAVRETIGKKNAFFSQVPGNQTYIPRVALITSENFVDFAPLHNVSSGFYDSNHLGSALTLVETPSKTPMYFNLHARGPKNDPAKGHSAWIGGNGSGKTSALMLCATELICRYGARIYSFDRNRGQDLFFRSIGKYFILSPEHANDLQLNPLQLEDSKANRSFCYQWLYQLAMDNDENVLSAEVCEHLKQCVDYGFDDLQKSHRKLSNILKILPANFPCWPQLRRWIKADNQVGDYAYLFDNDSDELSLSPYMGFDMTHFLDKEPDHVLTALFMYLFHRIEQTFNGDLVSVLLDEGWQYLMNSYWLQKLEKWLPTLRKANCQIHLATQSATTILNNPLRDVILNNIASQCIFGNPLAKESVYREGLQLTESEFQIIRELNPASRYFLYKQDRSSAICRFNMTHMDEDLVLLSSNYKNVRLADQLRMEVGDYPHRWVPELIRRYST